MHINRLTGNIIKIAFCLLIAPNIYAQTGTGQLLGQLNTQTTAVPFLMISPDARAGAMGDLGVATTPDANSMHWNPAKFVFNDFKTAKSGFSLNYTPWLRALVPDISLAHLSFYTMLDKQQAFSASLRYFSLGDITFTDNFGQTIGQFNPNEFAVDGGYSRKLSDYFSTGVALRFIYSNLTGRLDAAGQTRPGTSVAGDLAFYFKKPIEVSQRNADLMFGLNFSNIGAKISYTSSGQDNFLPTNVRLGSGLNIELDQFNSLLISGELSKLLVPTNPVYQRDPNTGQILFDNNGKPLIDRGQDPFSKGVIEGIFSSFNDAPGVVDGNGNIIVTPGREELREITQSLGLEYWYDKQFAVRGGFFNEHPTKGGRQYFTIGAGLKYTKLKLDFSYIIPTNRQLAKSPLENTIRFSLQFDISSFKTDSGN